MVILTVPQVTETCSRTHSKSQPHIARKFSLWRHMLTRDYITYSQGFDALPQLSFIEKNKNFCVSSLSFVCSHLILMMRFGASKLYRTCLLATSKLFLTSAEVTSHPVRAFLGSVTPQAQTNVFGKHAHSVLQYG